MCTTSLIVRRGVTELANGPCVARSRVSWLRAQSREPTSAVCVGCWGVGDEVEAGAVGQGESVLFELKVSDDGVGEPSLSRAELLDVVVGPAHAEVLARAPEAFEQRGDGRVRDTRSGFGAELTTCAEWHWTGTRGDGKRSLRCAVSVCSRFRRTRSSPDGCTWRTWNVTMPGSRRQSRRSQGVAPEA